MDVDDLLASQNPIMALVGVAEQSGRDIRYESLLDAFTVADLVEELQRRGVDTRHYLRPAASSPPARSTPETALSVDRAGGVTIHIHITPAALPALEMETEEYG
jgi:hypothetical protein